MKPGAEARLKKAYRLLGRSHNFMLMGNSRRHWALGPTKQMIDNVAATQAFNLVTIGDDHGADQGHIMTQTGLSPDYSGFMRQAVQYIHAKGMMAGIEPRNMPRSRSLGKQVRWWSSLLDPAIMQSDTVDVVKLSMEWVGGYEHDRDMVRYLDAAIRAIHKVNPKVLVYIDSLGAEWRTPRHAHAYLMRQHPNLVINLHAANPFSGNGKKGSIQAMVTAFRHQGLANLMVQINPNEGSQWFYYMPRTLAAVGAFLDTNARFLSIAGGNLGYDKDQLAALLAPIRPHLNLVHDVAELRANLRTNAPDGTVSLSHVRREAAQFWPRHYRGPLHRLITGLN